MDNLCFEIDTIYNDTCTNESQTAEQSIVFKIVPVPTVANVWKSSQVQTKRFVLIP